MPKTDSYRDNPLVWKYVQQRDAILNNNNNSPNNTYVCSKSDVDNGSRSNNIRGINSGNGAV